MSRLVSLDEVGSSNLEADSRCAVCLQTLAEKLMQVEDALYQISCTQTQRVGRTIAAG